MEKMFFLVIILYFIFGYIYYEEYVPDDASWIYKKFSLFFWPFVAGYEWVKKIIRKTP